MAWNGDSYEAVNVIKKYMQTKLEPFAHLLLAELYENCNEPAKAQAARAQGIAEREPRSVYRHVRYV
jgi:hypothetical protein